MEAVDNSELRARLDELEQELEASYSHLLRALMALRLLSANC